MNLLEKYKTASAIGQYEIEKLIYDYGDSRIVDHLCEQGCSSGERFIERYLFLHSNVFGGDFSVDVNYIH